MTNRTLKGAAIAGLLAAICSNAETCRDALLYDGSLYNGRMEESTRTFPEVPEWKANWGNFENMDAPYIRLSGIKNQKGDWTGNLVFDNFPLSLSGGKIRMSVRSTQNAKFGIWLTGNSGTGNVAFFNLKANTTQVIDTPVETLLNSGNVSVSKIGVGLFGVEANQYTTLFIDNLKFTCTANAAGSGAGSSVATGNDSESAPYYFRNVNPSSPTREFLITTVAAPKAALKTEERESYRLKTARKFVLDEQEHRQITNFQEAKSLTAKKSREGWYKSLFIVERKRIEDNAIASPKNLFHEAGEIAAESGNTIIPLLVADIDYAIKRYTDTTFIDYKLEDYHLLLAGLATSETRGSKVKVVYDPFFVTTTRNSLPNVEVCVASKCQNLEAGKEISLEFGSAGEQAITVKLRSGNTSVQQNLKLEVK